MQSTMSNVVRGSLRYAVTGQQMKVGTVTYTFRRSIIEQAKLNNVLPSLVELQAAEVNPATGDNFRIDLFDALIYDISKNEVTSDDQTPTPMLGTMLREDISGKRIRITFEQTINTITPLGVLFGGSSTNTWPITVQITYQAERF
ncbi:MAG: hypothetical protein HC904_12630 [Blastochloris sp.]|nr:hypothetical protein [Blastochloris sp.]